LPSPTLVTGATGFVGSAVARALARRGAALRLLVRPGSDRRNIAGLNAELAEGDLLDHASLARAVIGCRDLVHVAADYRLWVPNPASMVRANVDGTRALLEAAGQAGVERIVYCSSVAALGLIGDGTPGTETTPVDPAAIAGVYKRSKWAAQEAVLELARAGLPVVVVNPAAPIGPRDLKPTPTGRMVLDAAAGRMPAYVDTGLNVVHVDDVGEGHAAALERGRPGECYILGGDDMPMATILAQVDQAMGRSPRRRARLPIPTLWPIAIAAEALGRTTGITPLVTRDMLRMAKKRMYFSSAKARAELGYAPRPAASAIQDAVAWFREAGMLPR